MLTTEEQNIFDYLQSVYPQGLRFSAYTEYSLLWKYDYVRSFTFANLYTWVQDAVARLQVNTSDEDWVLEREYFLQLPVNPALSLEMRKARILSKLSGNPATITNLRTVIESFTGWWPETYKIYELWKETPFNVDDTWTYIVDLYDPNPLLDIPWLITILNEVHPAHCILIMWKTKPVVDAIWTEALTDSATHDPFIWGIEWVPAPTDAIWFGWSYIWWGYWS